MTEKLYERDSYIKEFTAKILSSDENGTVLDKTAFFPEGGGQYGDIGYINGVRVSDTQIKDSIIYHKTESPVKTGEAKCEVDWSIRYNRMQNHTGEHILSGVIHKKYGYNNVGFHLSDEEVTLDVDGKFTDKDIIWIEDEVNRLIDGNKAVTVLYPSSDELPTLEYRSKLDLTEGVRIVKIDGVDMCACCAPHVARTSEVGLLKIVRHYNYKGGTRLHILCGAAARKDYSILSEQCTHVVNAASAKRYELCGIFERYNNEIRTVKEELQRYKSLLISKTVSSESSEDATHLYFESEFTFDDILRLADLSVKTYPNALTAAFCGSDDGGYNFVIAGKNATDIFPDFKSRFNARGGGRDIYQGKVQAHRSELEEYFKERK